MIHQLPADQAELLMRGIASAVRDKGELTPTQAGVLSAVGKYLVGVDRPVDQLEPVTPEQFAAGISDEWLRRRALNAMVTLEIITDPVQPEVTEQVEKFATAMKLEDGLLSVARDYSKRAMNIAVQDLIRNSYVFEWRTQHPDDPALHATVKAPPGPPTESAADPGLLAMWKGLESCPSGSLGRTVWDFYQMRGFTLPGTPGAVDPLLAQHDWVHCLADYGTSATGEIEVFTFIASAIPDSKGFSYAVILLGLFETGYQPVVPGVATANPGHLSEPGGATRFVDALRRGMAVDRDVMGGTDWFQYADTPIDDVRQKLAVPPKSADAVAAGSLSAMDPNAVFKKA